MDLVTYYHHLDPVQARTIPASVLEPLAAAALAETADNAYAWRPLSFLTDLVRNCGMPPTARQELLASTRPQHVRLAVELLALEDDPALVRYVADLDLELALELARSHGRTPADRIDLLWARPEPEVILALAARGPTYRNVNPLPEGWTDRLAGLPTSMLESAVATMGAAPDDALTLALTIGTLTALSSAVTAGAPTTSDDDRVTNALERAVYRATGAQRNAAGHNLRESANELYGPSPVGSWWYELAVRLRARNALPDKVVAYLDRVEAVTGTGLSRSALRAAAEQFNTLDSLRQEELRSALEAFFRHLPPEDRSRHQVLDLMGPSAALTAVQHGQDARAFEGRSDAWKIELARLVLDPSSPSLSGMVEDWEAGNADIAPTWLEAVLPIIGTEALAAALGAAAQEASGSEFLQSLFLLAMAMGADPTALVVAMPASVLADPRHLNPDKDPSLFERTLGGVFTEHLGSSASAWETFLRLSSEFDGSISELLRVSAALA